MLKARAKYIHFLKRVLKAAGIFLALIAIICIALAVYFKPATDQEFFVSFSAPYARYLGLNDKVTFAAILQELKPKQVRLASYWYDVEKERGKYDFSSVDWQLEMAKRAGVNVVLAIGHKLPRWPECSQPGWYNDLSQAEKEEAIINILKQSVEHYKKYNNIVIWQVENEPRLHFGANCPIKTKEFLQKEVAIVRSIDPRPILMTDGGEFGRWIPTASVSPDLFGATLYRKVKMWGADFLFTYPIPPQFFWVKGGMVKLLTGKDKIIGVELQAEPWNIQGVLETPIETQLQHFNVETFLEYVDYAKTAGMTDYYLWGTEWWYWMKIKNNHPEFWETAKIIISEK